MPLDELLVAIQSGTGGELFTRLAIRRAGRMNMPAVVGLLVEDRLNTESLEAKGLIPIDTSVLARALPATIFRSVERSRASTRAMSSFRPG